MVAFAVILPILLSSTTLSQESTRERPDPPEPSPYVGEDLKRRLLEEVSEIRDGFVSKRQDHILRALNAFKTALESDEKAYQLWVDCVKAVTFDAQGRTASDFRDWRLDLSATHRTREFYAALRLQLLLLVATIQASESKSIATAIPAVHELIDYYTEVEEYIEYPRELEGRRRERLRGTVRRMASANVLSTEFAQYFKLDELISPPVGWVKSPTGIDQFFDSIFLPHYRNEGDATRIGATWNRRIRMHQKFAETRKAEGDEEDFLEMTEVEIPQLYWSRNLDLFDWGDSERSAEAMLAMIKGNMTHPNVLNWMEELISLLGGDPDELGEDVAEKGRTLAELLGLSSDPESQDPETVDAPQPSETEPDTE